MKILIVGDLHADASTAGVSRYEDVARSLRAAARLAIEQRCDGVVQLGDLCDPGPQASRCAALAIGIAGWLARESLGRPSIWSRWIVGNHDVVEDGAGASTLEPIAAAGAALPPVDRDFMGRLVDVWSEPCFEWLSEDVVAVALPHPARGRAYVPADFISRLAFDREEPRVVIVFGHLTVPGMQPGSETLEMPRGREVLFPVAECVARWGDRVVMINGHYHRQSRRADGPVVIPGSVERLTRGEVRNEPGLLILEV